MKFLSFFKKVERQQCPPPEDGVVDSSQEDQTLRSGSSRIFTNLNKDSQQIKQAATHNRTESNETSITQQLSINESYSADGQNFVGEVNGSFEMVSPNHMVKYRQSLLELDAIREENFREGQSLDGSASNESAEVSLNASLKKQEASLPNMWDERDQDSEGGKPKLSSTRHILPRMIQMNGSILENIDDSWIDSMDLCNRSHTQVMQAQPGSGSGLASLLDKEGSSSSSGDDSADRAGLFGTKQKTHRRSSRNYFNFLGFFSRHAAAGLPPVRGESSPDSVAENPTSPIIQNTDDNAEIDLEQRAPNEHWTTPDGIPRFLA